MKQFMTETEDGYWIYETHDEETLDNNDFKLWLPKPPDNIGWFKVKFLNGLEYTVYDLEEMIDGVSPHREDIVEQEIGNEKIIFMQDLLKTLSEDVNKETAEKLVTKLVNEYDIKPYS